MLKKSRILVVFMVLMMAFSSQSYGAVGDELGHFGGISEGINLPKSIDKYVNNGIKPPTSFQYKEIAFISGEPIVLEGTLTLNIKDEVVKTKASGTYTEQYTFVGNNAEKEAQLNRVLRFTTSYRVIDGEFKKQVVRDSTLTGWTETLVIGGATYTLNPSGSTYSKASVEDLTPGVSYYQTSISYIGQYTSADGSIITLSAEGKDYGFSQPWSKVETQTREMSYQSDSDTYENLEVSLNSVLEAKKTIYYDETVPFPISFGGTYNQRLERSANLNYQIHTVHPKLTKDKLTGSVSIVSANSIEKLPIPENLEFVQGHWAEEDFKQLYSMGIMTEIPHLGMQYQSITRGDYIKALVLAMNLDITPYARPTSRSEVVFGDVGYKHPLYPYIMAAYKAKLVKGTGDNFSVSDPISRQEAFVIYIRVIGLERLGTMDQPTSPFVDDRDIASWAKKEIVAGYKLGIIKGNTEQKLLPNARITKAEAAVIINRLISYLREDMATDYKNVF